MAKKLYLEEVDKLIDKTVDKTEKLLLVQYKQTLVEINIKLQDVYNKYSKDGILTKSDMFKFNRLKKLQDNIFDDIGKLGNLKKEELIKLSESAYTEAHSLAFQAVAKELPEALSYVHPSRALILASVGNKIGGMTLNQRLSQHGTQIKSEISNQITQGLILGEDYKRMAKRIQTALEGDLNKAIRVARTEAHRNQMSGRQEAFNLLAGQGADVVKEWLSTKSNRTRDDHIKLDGQQVPVDGYFEIDGMKAKHPGGFGKGSEDINCRCTMVVVLI